MAAKPIKSLEWHYTMIQFLIKDYRPQKTAVDLSIIVAIKIQQSTKLFKCYTGVNS